MNKEFEVLVDKCAKRLAEGKKPHKATLNKMYQYPGTTAEYRMKRLDNVMLISVNNTSIAKPNCKPCLHVPCQVLVLGKRLVNQLITILNFYNMDKILKYDIREVIADYENERITDHELIDFLKEITAE